MPHKRLLWALILFPWLVGCPTRTIYYDAGTDRGSVDHGGMDGSESVGGAAGNGTGGAPGGAGTGGSGGPAAGGAAGHADGGTAGHADLTGAAGSAGSAGRGNQCQDGLQNGVETDVDCGGGTCPACDVNKACLTNTDCSTGSCSRLFCALASGPPYWLPGPSLNEGRAYMTVGMAVSGSAFQLYAFGAAVSGTDPVTGEENQVTYDYELLDSQTQPQKWVMAGTLPSDIGHPTDTVATTPSSWAVTEASGDLLLFSAGGIWKVPYFGNLVKTSIVVPPGNTALGAAYGKDGLIYLVGWAAYDPTRSTWSTGLPPPPTTRNEAAVVSGQDGLIYTIGGYTSAGDSADVEAYDPITARWISKSSLPTPDRGLAGVTGPDARIYTFGGWAPPNSTGAVGSGAVNAYTSLTNRWTTVAPLADKLVGVGAIASPDGHIWAIGGTINPEGSGQTIVRIYGPAISIAPTAAQPGTSASITGGNFAANAQVHVYLGPVTGQPIANGATDAEGSLLDPITFSVPSLPAGVVSVTAVDDRSQYPVSLQFRVQ